MGIELAPYFQFLTLQIAAPGGQNIWLDLENGLSVIYGLNGTGKTTIINGINRLFRGEKEKSRELLSDLEYPPGRSRGYFGFPASLFMCEIAYEVFDEFTSLNPQLELKKHFHGFDYFEIRGIDVGIDHEDKEGSISQFKAWYLDETLDKQKPILTSGLLLDALNDASNSQAKLDVINLLPSIILNDAIEQQGQYQMEPRE